MARRSSWSRPLLVLVLGFTALACEGSTDQPAVIDPAGDPPPPFDRVPPAPGELDAALMVQRLGRGMNIGNALDAPKEGEWGVTVQQAYFEIIKQAGFHSVRVPVRWSAHASSQPPYTIDPQFLRRVDNVVGYGLGRGLPVVLDIHHYDEMYPDPAAHHDRFLALWRQLAEHYADYPSGLVFELLNEPRDAMTAELWNGYLNEAIAVIRQTNPGRTLMVGGVNWNGLRNLQNVAFPPGDNNIIGTFHYYNPFSVTHQGSGDNPAGVAWLGTAEEKAAIDADLDTIARWRDTGGRPLYLGEFGVHISAEVGTRARLTAHVARASEQRGIAWAYWEIVSEFGALAPNSLQWIPEIRDALIPPG